MKSCITEWNILEESFKTTVKGNIFFARWQRAIVYLKVVNILLSVWNESGRLTRSYYLRNGREKAEVEVASTKIDSLVRQISPKKLEVPSVPSKAIKDWFCFSMGDVFKTLFCVVIIRPCFNSKRNVELSADIGKKTVQRVRLNLKPVLAATMYDLLFFKNKAVNNQDESDSGYLTWNRTRRGSERRVLILNSLCIGLIMRMYDKCTDSIV